MNLDEIILLKEKELKALKKEKYREEHEEEIARNIQFSFLEKELIKRDFEQHTKDKVFSYFNQCSDLFRFCSKLVWDDEEKQFTLWVPVLQKNPIKINKDFGKRKIIQRLKDEEDRLERLNKNRPEEVKKYLAQVIIKEELPEGFEILNGDFEYNPELRISYKGRQFNICLKSNRGESYFEVKLATALDFNMFRKFKYLFSNIRHSIVKTGSNPIDLIQEITGDIETLQTIFSSYK